MSIFQKTQLACPGCGTEVDFQTVHSVNIDRKAELRDQILAGTFQQEKCPSCDKSFRLDPRFTYVDLGRKQWIAVHELDQLERWQEVEEETKRLFDAAYGAQAPLAARVIGKTLRPRLVFGWAALSEKLIADQDGLDDVQLELMKIGLLRNLQSSKFTLEMETELRFTGASDGDDGPELNLAWLAGRWSVFLEGMTVPRGVYDDIEQGGDEWKALRESLSAGPFVDMERLIVVGSESVE